MDNIQRKSNVIFLADTVLFTNAMTFLSVTAVIPFFLSGLGASTFQMGLASALVSIGTFVSQPVFAKKAMSLPRKIDTFVRLLIIQRLFFLVFLVILPFLKGESPRVTILLFLICWGIFNFFTGCYSPFYMSIFSKMVPANQRGRILGYSGAIANVIALAAAYFVSVLLKSFTYPMNFTVIFCAGTILLLADAYVLSLLKEPPEEATAESINYFKYIGMIKNILTEDGRFKLMIAGYSFFAISNVNLAYYTIYAIRCYHTGANTVGIFAAITVAAMTLGNFMFGTIGDRYGHRIVLQAAAFCGLAASIVILCFTGIHWIYIAFVLSDLCSAGFTISNGVYIIENCPKERLPVYISINAMVTLVISAAMTIAASFIIDKISFAMLFIISGVAALLALCIFIRLKNKQNAISIAG
jgi:MFS family permease